MPRINETPRIEVHVVDSAEEPTGIGRTWSTGDCASGLQRHLCRHRQAHFAVCRSARKIWPDGVRVAFINRPWLECMDRMIARFARMCPDIPRIDLSVAAP
jgi:hypothetical protein